jgi:hypothetical protein
VLFQAPNGEWNEMNDTQVSVVSTKTALSAQAYVLFYVRADNVASMNASVPIKDAKVTKTENSETLTGVKRKKGE